MKESENLFLVEVDDEDLAITEKWLVKVSVIEENVDENDELVSKKLVFELIERVAGDDPFKTLELGYELSKLPVLSLTTWQKRMLASSENGRFIFEKRYKRKENHG